MTTLLIDPITAVAIEVRGITEEQKTMLIKQLEMSQHATTISTGEDVYLHGVQLRIHSINKKRIQLKIIPRKK